MRPAVLSLAVLLATVALAARPDPASAIDPLKPVCGLTGWFSGIAGKACGVLAHGDRLIRAGKKLASGHVGGAVKSLLGDSGTASSIGGKTVAAVGLAAIGAWVLAGARATLHDTATVIDTTTRPQLETTWFSATYWRMAGISTLLTLPFLFAAAIQALIRSDLALLVRAALGYLPLSLLAVAIAAPLTMLLLAASDQISGIVSAAAGGAGTRFLAQLGLITGTLSLLSRSPFVAFFIGLLTVSAAVFLWVEMLMREAAVYIVVLMLPLAFAAFVWPARRVWAIRVVEVLIALILSKFAIVAVLALGGAALGQRGAGGTTGMLAGLVLVTLAALAPWALLRLLPMTELASAAAGHFRGEAGQRRAVLGATDAVAGGASDWAGSVTASMRRQAAQIPEAEPAAGDDGAPAEVGKLAAARGVGATEPEVGAGEATAGEPRVGTGAATADRAGATTADRSTGTAVAGVALDVTPSVAGQSPPEQRPAGVAPMEPASYSERSPMLIGPEASGPGTRSFGDGSFGEGSFAQGSSGDGSSGRDPSADGLGADDPAPPQDPENG
jgi:hypothetical protein